MTILLHNRQEAFTKHATFIIQHDFNFDNVKNTELFVTCYSVKSLGISRDFVVLNSTLKILTSYVLFMQKKSKIGENFISIL